MKSVKHLWQSDFMLIENISSDEVTYMYDLRFTSVLTYADMVNAILVIYGNLDRRGRCT
jgi:hypothetical protein